MCRSLDGTGDLDHNRSNKTEREQLFELSFPTRTASAIIRLVHDDKLDEEFL